MIETGAQDTGTVRMETAAMQGNDTGKMPALLVNPHSAFRNPQSQAWLFAPLLLLALFVAVLLRTAWVSDDAFITFRVLDNFVSGHGLRWNVAERVWAFTNPLWLFALAPFYAVTREALYTSLAVSVALSALTFWLVVARRDAGRLRALLAGLLLLCSKAFVDFSTSGLENPLSNLLLVAFVLTLLGREEPGAPPRTTRLALLAALAILCRPDAALLYVPALAWLFFSRPGWRTARALLIGLSPLAAWELFALIYYGFPFPNTAYAKLAFAVGQAVRLRQGAAYFLNAVDNDPLTVATILAGLALAAVSRRRPLQLLGAGLALHLAYVLWIGGDFMSGRFFSIALLAAVLIIGTWPPRVERSQEAFACALLIFFGVLNARATLQEGSAFGNPPMQSIDFRGIADERKYYYAVTGLLHTAQHRAMPATPLADLGMALRAMGEQSSQTLCYPTKVAGIIGYYSGPRVHLIDPVALSDAFLVRMPGIVTRGFRPGHVDHRVPAEYAASIQSGRNLIRDRMAARLYDAVACITRDPLFSARRLREIVKINTGAYDDLIRRIGAECGDGQTRLYGADLTDPIPEGTPWNGTGVLHLDAGGVTLLYDSPQRAARLEATLLQHARFGLEFRLGGQSVATAELATAPGEAGTLKAATLAVPASARAGGFDSIALRPLRGEGVFCLGHLRLLDSPTSGGLARPGARWMNNDLR